MLTQAARTAKAATITEAQANIIIITGILHISIPMACALTKHPKAHLRANLHQPSIIRTPQLLQSLRGQPQLPKPTVTMKDPASAALLLVLGSARQGCIY